MAIVKIYYHNCEEEGTVELEINCRLCDYNAVRKLIYEFKKANPFHTGTHNFIEYLKKNGFDAKEIEYDMVVH